MKRIAPLFLAVALVLAVGPAATAQVNLSFGRGGTTLSLGQPSYGYGYGYGSYAQPGLSGVPYGVYASPYAPYNGYGLTNNLTPYAAGTTTYSSAYRGYVAPGTTVIQQRTYTASPYGYGYGYGTLSPYAGYGTSYPYAGYGSPYGYNYGYQGVPLIRGNGFSVDLVPR